jgi:hypothetical protein
MLLSKNNAFGAPSAVGVNIGLMGRSFKRNRKKCLWNSLIFAQCLKNDGVLVKLAPERRAYRLIFAL